MRAYIFILFSFLFQSANAQSLFFSLPIEVAPAPSGAGQRPRIILVHDSIPLVAYGRTGSDPALFVSRWNGSAFSSQVRITPLLTMPLVSMIDGPEIKSYGDTVFLCHADHTNAAGVIVYRSFDGGLSFPDSVNVYNNVNDHCEFADLTILPNGNPVVSFLRADLAFTVIEMLVSSSSDGGNTYSSPVNASSVNPGLPCECCPSSIISSGTDVYLGYRNDVSNVREFYLSHSSDGGLTFSTGIKIDSSAYMSVSCPSNGIKLFLNNDSIYSIYAQKPSGDPYMNIYGRALNVNDQSLGNLFTAEPTFPTANQFRPVITGSNDTLFALWQDGRDGNLDVFISYRTASSNGFTVPQKVSHVFPSAQTDVDAIYKNGLLHIVWLDQQSQKVFYRRASFNEFLGINENSKNPVVKIYPNPSEENLCVSIAEGRIKSILIYDNKGAVLPMKTQNYTQEINIPLNGLSSGMYVLEIRLENDEVIRKSFIRN